MRNVILIIGDGFDDQHVTMGRNYLAGMSGKLRVDDLPFRASVQIETVTPSGTPSYVADSANTATSLATGTVTSMGRIATDINDRDVATIGERAIAAGFKVGLVTTSSLTDATPASFLTHVSARSCEGPEEVLGSTYYGIPQPACLADARDNDGPGSIIEQLVSSGASILLGGGRKFIEQTTIDNETVAAMAAHYRFRVVTNAGELRSASLGQPLIGVFSEETLAVRWRGTDGRTAEATETGWLHYLSDYLGDIKEPDVMDCEPNPEYGDTPSLSIMTKTALEHLSTDNDQGFFLMIESASIDKQSHKRDPCGSIGEIEQLEEALDRAQTFAQQHPDTLIIVTADHAQAAQILPEPTLYSGYPIPIYSPGLTARINTPEGGVMRINYATNNGFSEEHTGANVPLFANEVGAQQLRPFLRQREVHDAMSLFLLGPAAAPLAQNTSPESR
jgi:alkaline phosphatase